MLRYINYCSKKKGIVHSHVHYTYRTSNGFRLQQETRKGYLSSHLASNSTSVTIIKYQNKQPKETVKFPPVKALQKRSGQGLSRIKHNLLCSGANG